MFGALLLQVGSKHLVEYQLGMLADAGIGPVGMVLGYNADADKKSWAEMRAFFQDIFGK